MTDIGKAESGTRRGVEFGILGPLRATIDGVPVPVPAAQHRVLLGALLMRANHVVPVSALTEYLWADAPPAGARAGVQTYVYRLRRAFGRSDLIVTHGDGYLIDTSPGSIDLHRFRDLLDEADKAALHADPVAESAHLRAALALWRGRTLADVASGPLRALAVALDEERLRVIERCVDAELATGRHADLIPELRGLTGEHPLRERYWQQLMLALYAGGRQAEALEAFRTIDRKLRDDLGIEPAPHGNLEAWARQGVLLLNATLTVRAGQAASHQGKGWETFTDEVIKTVDGKDHPVVFILWGSHARKKKALIDTARHTIIESAHPSPLSASNGFFGSRPFSRTNAALIEAGLEPINSKVDP